MREARIWRFFATFFIAFVSFGRFLLSVFGGLFRPETLVICDFHVTHLVWAYCKRLRGVSCRFQENEIFVHVDKPG